MIIVKFVKFDILSINSSIPVWLWVWTIHFHILELFHGMILLAFKPSNFASSTTSTKTSCSVCQFVSQYIYRILPYLAQCAIIKGWLISSSLSTKDRFTKLKLTYNFLYQKDNIIAHIVLKSCP